MTRDDIIKMAREAGFNPVTFMGAGFELFERFAALVAEAEREACAQACDTVYYKHIGPHHAEVRYGVAACARAIRARGNA
jgi:hypothetical protein